MEHGARDVLAGLDTECLRVQGKVWILVCAEHVIALQARVQAMLGPHAARSRAGFQDGQALVRVELVKRLCSCKTEPSCGGIVSTGKI